MPDFLAPPTPEIRDFTDKAHSTPRQFKIDNDIFQCARVIPASVGRVLATLIDASPIDQFDGLGTVLDMIMLPDSAKRFAERMQSPTEPISLDQLNDVMAWLLEEYGGRPTTPAGNSSALPASSGQSSMDGPVPEVSTSA